ncbi:MAG: AMP-binding protein, partial [Candidatus Sulfotelmatobacter sp.]
MTESLAQFFLEHFEAHREELAYRQRAGYRSESFTYGEIMHMALAFAGEMRARGIQKGDRVMLWGENSAEWVAAFFGCAVSGVVAVPMDDGASPDFAIRVAGQVQAKLWAGSGDNLEKLG